MIKWMRHCLGKKSFAPHIRDIIRKHLSRFDHLHDSEKAVFFKKNGEEITSVINKVVDVNLLVETTAAERGLVNPKIIPFMDGSIDKCIVRAVIMDKDENESECLEKYKATGSKRVLLLAQVNGVPESRPALPRPCLAWPWPGLAIS